MDYTQEQLILEAEAVSDCAVRYRSNLRIRGTGETQPGHRLLTTLVEPFAKIIEEQLEHASRAKRGPRSRLLPKLKELSPSQLALITIRQVMGSLTERMQKHLVAKSIGTLVAENAEWQMMVAEKGGLAHKVSEQLKTTQLERHRRAVVRKVLNTYSPEHHWTEDEMRGVGEYLLKELVETGLLVSQHNVYNAGKQKTTSWIKPLPAVVELLEAGHARCELLDPILAPMVCKPTRWEGIYGGGYLTKSSCLIKTSNPEYLKEVANADMPEVYDAVNALQEVPYRINRSVLGVLNEAWMSNSQIEGMVDREQEPLPAKNFDADADPEALKRWKRAAAQVHDRNAQKVSRRYAVQATISMATKFAEYPEIYFPHSYDWRGRIYPMSVYINPQSDDIGKGLLQFGDGKVLGEHGAYWLKVHIANVFGEDKVSLDDRVKWTEAHAEEIMACTVNPLDQEFWQQADKPWQALAACYEFTGYMVMGDEYVSHLLIAMDGTCNGLQHLSAMLRDEVGGTATNLVPADKPGDIYTQVLNIVKDELEVSDDIEAELWLQQGVDRNTVKHPVMCTPYGLSRTGMRDQIMGMLRPTMKHDMGASMRRTWGNDVEKCNGHKERAEYVAATYLAPKVHSAIGSVVVASNTVMTWLQDAAKIAAKAGKPLRWTTPCGLVVLQDYQKMKSKPVTVHVGTHKVWFKSVYAVGGINTRKQGNSISPNVIHSLDAAHMVKTVNACVPQGVESLCMVHDSYATHACDVSVLNKVIREEFVKMYSVNILENLQEQFVAQLDEEVSEKFPPLPTLGTLDIEGVLESKYFFA